MMNLSNPRVISISVEVAANLRLESCLLASLEAQTAQPIYNPHSVPFLEHFYLSYAVSESRKPADHRPPISGSGEQVAFTLVYFMSHSLV